MTGLGLTAGPKNRTFLLCSDNSIFCDPPDAVMVYNTFREAPVVDRL
jgi:hypothetical protein